MNNKYLKKNNMALKDFDKLDNIYKQIFNEVVNCVNNGNKLIFIGNGGSAADSSHIVGDMLSLGKNNSLDLPAIALGSNNAILTAIGNDYSFDDIFTKQLASLGNDGDILFAITTSGTSKNILKAINKAKSMKIKTILITGKSRNCFADYIVNFSSDETTIVQNMYIIFLHMLCLDLEEYYNEYRN